MPKQRKTGLTIPENARDELGIEAIGGIFSSPRKSSPAKQLNDTARVSSANRQNDPDHDVEVSDADGDEMDFTSTVGRVIQGPMEDLRAFSSVKGKVSLPPPRRRSPMKTSLGSSPRRPPSMPAVSSPVPPSRRGYVPNQISSSPRPDVEISASQAKSVNRRLDFSMASTTPSGAVPSVGKSRSSLRQQVSAQRDGPESATKGVFAKGRLSPSQQRPERKVVGRPSQTKKRGLLQKTIVEPDEDDGDLSESEPANTRAQESYQEASQDMQGNDQDDDALPGGADSSGAMQYDDDIEQVPADEEEEADTAGGHDEEELGGDDANGFEEEREGEEGHDEEGIEEEEVVEVVPPKKTKTASKSSSQKAGRRAEPAVQKPDPTTDRQATVTAQKRGRGRPPKRPLPVEESPAVDEQEPEPERPAKRGRIAKAPKAKIPPSQRNPKARIVGKRTSTTSEASPAPPPTPPPTDKPKKSRKRKSTELEALTALNTRSNYRPHLLAAPEEDPTAVRTRSGRTAVKPMEWWRNEKAIYTGRNSLTAIVRTEEVVATTRKNGTRGKKASRRKPRQEEDQDDDDEDEEAEMEDWEREPGIMVGEVKGYDPEPAPGAEPEVVETGKEDIALSAR